MSAPAHTYWSHLHILANKYEDIPFYICKYDIYYIWYMQIAEHTADLFNALVLKTCSHIDKGKTVTIQYFPQSEHLILDGFENKS